MQRIENIHKIYEKLVDDTSKKIFEAYLSYTMEERNFALLEDKLWSLTNQSACKCPVTERFYSNHSKCTNIIFGAGVYGRRYRHELEKMGINIAYYCDNDKSKTGTYIDGLLCLSVDDVCENYEDYNIILCSPDNRKEMFDQLITGRFPYENILYLRFGQLVLFNDKQYFDTEYLKPKGKNIFIDAGSYDGQSTSEFIAWCGNNYEKVFCFEPSKNSYNAITNKFINNRKIQIINAGTWNRAGKVGFIFDGAGSRITECPTDENTIDVVTIDQIVGEDKVSFIKMDVEGAESESLEGAQSVIKRNKPHLAVCTYHKPLDFIDIPLKILEYVPEYKFAFRHYSNTAIETVLYAFID